MVLKGQIFMLDVTIAFFVILLMFFFFLNVTALSNRTMTESYQNFVKEKRLLDASEKLVSIELADYSENTLKHHVLSLDKIADFSRLSLEEIKQNLLLEDYDVYLSLKSGDKRLLSFGNAGDGIMARRIALCGNEVCVLEISAK
jgi:hypothetical protein